MISILILFAIVGSIRGQFSSDCNSYQSCSECIQSPSCAWCPQTDFHDSDKKLLPRCTSPKENEALGRFKCQNLFYPENELVITKDENFSEKRENGFASMRPQKVSLKLKVGESVSLPVEYKDPENYPLDLYYLMDLTYTMVDDKEMLAAIGGQISERIKSITNNFRMGFGSFIDKVAMPYVMMDEKSLNNPCGDKLSGTCVKPYGFKNHLKITQDIEQFTEVVKNTPFSSGIDRPEGGLDALMQAMVCTKEIGWNQARRLILFATDDTSHIAGDGQLGGIIHPNDGECHLNEKGEYTHSTLMDYPSIAQLNYKAIQNSVSIIFSVTAEHEDVYTKLTKMVEGSQIAITLNNSSNIVDLVEAEYRKITSTVEIKDDLPQEYVGVKYFSSCLDGVDVERNTCRDLPLGSTVNFRVEIKLTSCPKDRKQRQPTYKLYRTGQQLQDYVEIDLDMICSCECEKEEYWGKKSEMCNGFGAQKCGLCDCDTNHYGQFCECSGEDGLPQDESKACRRESETEICSGRGTCFCGQCNCEKRLDSTENYSGKFCECDNFSCGRINGKLCSGPEHGACECGKCQCKRGFMGAECDCATSTNECYDYDDDSICNGNGECKCGKCVCDADKPFSGQFCEKCTGESCPTKCLELAPCVECKVGRNDLEDCDPLCANATVSLVDVVSQNFDADEVYCKRLDEADGCSYVFSYKQDQRKEMFVNAQETKECPAPPNTAFIGGGIVAFILLTGIIAFIIWKVCTTIKDKNEYAKFHDETRNANFSRGDNPLYHNPVGTYENPAYGKRQ